MGVGNSFKGFETIFAAIRMFFQMLIRLFAVVLLLQICIIGSIIYFNHDKLFGKIDSTDICLFRTYTVGQFLFSISINKSNVMLSYSCEKTPAHVNYSDFMRTFKPYVESRLSVIKSKSLFIIEWSALVYLLLPMFLFYFGKKHKKDIEDKFIRGAKIVSADVLKKMIDKKSGMDYKFRITDRIQIQ